MNWKLVPETLTEPMSGVLRNEHCVYQTEQELYNALLEAAPDVSVGLEPVAYMAPTGTCVKAGYVSYTPNWTDYYPTPLVSQSAAAAVISAKDAEIERLTQSKAEWKKVADENLKGMSMCREQLAAKDAEISELQQNVQTTADALGHAHLELAVKQQQINAFYSGNPNGGIVARLQEQLTAVTATLEQYKRENTDQHHDIDRLRGLLAVAEKDRDELLAALEDAATSLETIQLRSYGDESYLNTMQQVRGYAGSRAGVAKESVKKAKGAV